MVQRKVQMECALVLTERETELLAYLSGYGPKALAELIGKKFSNRYETDEWERLWKVLREELEFAHRRFTETREVFSGIKRAAELEPKE